MLKAISKDAFRVRSIHALAATIQHAIELAQTAPSGVVSVEIPIDLQKMLLSAPELRFNFHPRLVPDPSCVKGAADILLSAKRPLIWSGNGVIQANGGRHIGVDLHGLNLEKLCEAYGIHYYRVTRVEAFRPAIESALVSGRLSLVEIDMGAVGPFSVPFAGYALSS